MTVDATPDARGAKALAATCPSYTISAIQISSFSFSFLPQSLAPNMSEAFPFTIPSSTAAGPSTSAKPSYGFKPPTQPRPRNGFVDAVRLKMAGIAPPSSARPDINLHAIAANLRTASEADLRELREAVQRRQVVENMMELGGVYFPG